MSEREMFAKLSNDINCGMYLRDETPEDIRNAIATALSNASQQPAVAGAVDEEVCPACNGTGHRDGPSYSDPQKMNMYGCRVCKSSGKIRTASPSQPAAEGNDVYALTYLIDWEPDGKIYPEISRYVFTSRREAEQKRKSMENPDKYWVRPVRLPTSFRASPADDGGKYTPDPRPLCEDCPPVGCPTDRGRCQSCPHHSIRQQDKQS